MSVADSELDQSLAGYETVPRHEIRFKPRRRAIARNLEASSRIPSLTADMQMDLTRLLAARQQWNAAPDRVDADRLAVMAMVAKAAVSALLEFTELNACYTERALVIWDTVNLGVAVDAPGGLMVPVIPDAQTLSAPGIAAKVRDLALRARASDLTIEELAGGTFTLSNPGSVGPSLRAEALLNPPQVALLGLPGMRRVPLAVETDEGEVVVVRPVLCPSLTFDHRALDGADAIRYLSALTQRVETWDLDHYLTTDIG